MSDKENLSLKENQGSSGERKKYEKKSDLMSEVDKFEKSISLSERIEVYLNSFKFQLKIFLAVFYLIPTLLSFVLAYMFVIDDGLLNLITEITGLEIERDSLISFFVSIYSGYLTYIDFGWLAAILGFTPADLINLYSRLLDLDPDTDSYVLILFTTGTYLSLTFISFGIFTFIFKDSILEAETSLQKLLKKLNKEYEKSKNLTAREFKSNFGDMSDYKNEMEQMSVNFKKDNDKLSKLKQEFIEVLKKGNYSMAEAKQAFNLGMKYKDSPFCNQIAGITNKVLVAKIEDLQTINNDEELYALLFLDFDKYQKSIIFNYNFNIFGDTGGKGAKIKGNFIKSWNRLKNNKNKKKEDYLKILSIIYTFKNYPLSLILKYLEKEGIVFTIEERYFIENFRWILNYFLEKEINPYHKIIDLPLKIMFPNIKNKEKLMDLYQKFLDVNSKQTLLLKSKRPNPLGKDATPEAIQAEEDRVNAELTELTKVYLISIKKILGKMIIIILNDYNIEVKDNFNRILTTTITEYYEIKTKMTLAQNQRLVSDFATFKIDDFYAILNIVRKKLGKYNKDILPYFALKYKSLKLHKTFVFMENDKSEIVLLEGVK